MTVSQMIVKLGNIVSETCFNHFFPCLTTSGNIVAETKFASPKATVFPNSKKIGNIFATDDKDSATMFPNVP